MKDIRLNTPFLKLQYWVSWFGFLVGGMLWAWAVAILLSNVGKITSADVKDKKDILNKTWQKFVFIYGSIIGDLVIVSFLLGILFS